MIRNESLTSSGLTKSIIMSENMHLKMESQLQQDIIPNTKILMKALCEDLQIVLKRNIRLEQQIKVILKRNCPFKSKEDHLCWVMKLTKKFSSRKISRSIVISAVKVLWKRDESFGKIKITETWTKSLLKCMGSVRRAKTSLIFEIPDGVRKEIEYQYLYVIVSAVEKWKF